MACSIATFRRLLVGTLRTLCLACCSGGKETPRLLESGNISYPKNLKTPILASGCSLPGGVVAGWRSRVGLHSTLLHSKRRNGAECFIIRGAVVRYKVGMTPGISSRSLHRGRANKSARGEPRIRCGREASPHRRRRSSVGSARADD